MGGGVGGGHLVYKDKNNEMGGGGALDWEHQLKFLMPYTESSKGPDMRPLFHGVLQDTSQTTSSTIQKERERERKTYVEKKNRVLYTNQRLTYSQCYSEMMSMKSVKLQGCYLMVMNKTFKYKHEKHAI